MLPACARGKGVWNVHEKNRVSTNLYMMLIFVEGLFLRTQVEGKKPSNKGSKQVTKPSGPSGRNDGSQVHEINKWGLRR